MSEKELIETIGFDPWNYDNPEVDGLIGFCAYSSGANASPSERVHRQVEIVKKFMGITDTTNTFTKGTDMMIPHCECFEDQDGEKVFYRPSVTSFASNKFEAWIEMVAAKRGVVALSAERSISQVPVQRMLLRLPQYDISYQDVLNTGGGSGWEFQQANPSLVLMFCHYYLRLQGHIPLLYVTEKYINNIMSGVMFLLTHILFEVQTQVQLADDPEAQLEAGSQENRPLCIEADWSYAQKWIPGIRKVPDVPVEFRKEVYNKLLTFAKSSPEKEEAFMEFCDWCITDDEKGVKPYPTEYLSSMFSFLAHRPLYNRDKTRATPAVSVNLVLSDVLQPVTFLKDTILPAHATKFGTVIMDPPYGYNVHKRADTVSN